MNAVEHFLLMIADAAGVAGERQVLNVTSPYDDALIATVAMANALDVAFQASVYSRKIDTALGIAGRLAASAVMINDHTAFRVDWMPFAGLKHSGLGVGGIPFTIRDMQIEKMIVIHSDAIQ